ncbi:MAG: AAA family ATPase, partial [Porticoccaceae bacterium]|nr:AAA family ATPase [Porticoccaceae bacterium]
MNDTTPDTPAEQPPAPESAPQSESRKRLDAAITDLQNLREQIGRAFIGQSQVIDQALVCLVASGHALVEGVPGLGKTLLVRALAKAVGGEFSRVQFTPDLMPSDVTGHAMYDMKSEQF